MSLKKQRTHKRETNTTKNIGHLAESGNIKDDSNYKVEDIFGKNSWNYINENLSPGIKMRKKEFKGKTIYRADGYLGNFIIVDPESKIVAIRMISHESYENENDGFMNFENMVINLTK